MQGESKTNPMLSLQGDHADLFEALYTELRHLASMVMSESGRGHKLQPTAIAAEARSAMLRTPQLRAGTNQTTLSGTGT